MTIKRIYNLATLRYFVTVSCTKTSWIKRMEHGESELGAWNWRNRCGREKTLGGAYSNAELDASDTSHISPQCLPTSLCTAHVLTQFLANNPVEQLL